MSLVVEIHSFFLPLLTLCFWLGEIHVQGTVSKRRRDPEMIPRAQRHQPNSLEPTRQCTTLVVSTLVTLLTTQCNFGFPLYWLVLCQLDTARVITEKGASVEEMPP
jgi:tellurite resistance protein TehA-like permease